MLFKALSGVSQVSAAKRIFLSLAATFPLCLAGCHSPFIEATLVNHSGASVRLVELDYPSASFGTQTLEDGSTFHYRFEVIGEGPVKLSWTDAQQKEHDFQGPAIHEGQEGTISVTITPGQPAWRSALHTLGH